MKKPPDKKQRRELRERLLPAAIGAQARLLATGLAAGAVAPAGRDVEKAMEIAKGLMDNLVLSSLVLADELAVAALNYDNVLEEKERTARAEAKQKQRESDALAKNNRKALRGDFDAGPESSFT